MTVKTIPKNMITETRLALLFLWGNLFHDFVLEVAFNIF